MNDKSSSLVSTSVLLTLFFAIVSSFTLAMVRVVIGNYASSIYFLVMAVVSCFGLWLWIKDPE